MFAYVRKPCIFLYAKFANPILFVRFLTVRCLRLIRREDARRLPARDAREERNARANGTGAKKICKLDLADYHDYG
jgi:hypothetical protein